MPYIKHDIIVDTDNFIKDELSIGEIKTEDGFNLEEELLKLSIQGFISRGD